MTEGLIYRAKGAYGAVYKYIGDDGRTYAVKRLHDILLGRGKEQEVSDDERKCVVEKFENECQILKGLNHANVVKFVKVEIGPDGRDLGDISLVMEYVDLNLKEFLQSNPGCSSTVRFGILQDVASGLCYLHCSNVIHRDLNQGNVLITKDSTAKIADLGCSRLFPVSKFSKAMTVCPGAQDYMPPEALKADAVYGPKLDCFSFGHLSLYICNNEYPVPDDDEITAEDASKNHRQIAKRRQALLKLHHKFPFLSDLIEKCLSDKPKSRPTSKQIFNWLLQCSLRSHKEVESPQTHPNSIIAVDFGSTAVKVAYKIAQREEVMDFYFKERLKLLDTSLLLNLMELKGLKLRASSTNSWVMRSFRDPSQRTGRLSIPAVTNILTFTKQEVEKWMEGVGLPAIESFSWSIAVSGCWSKVTKDNILEAVCSPTLVQSQPILIDKSQAAALWCYNSSPELASRTSSFLTVHIGSSSTDVAIHWSDEKNRLVTGYCSGVECGAETINRLFYSFLSNDILGDRDFQISRKASSVVDCYADLSSIFSDFEETKKDFMDDPDCVMQQFPLPLPCSFIEIYEKKLKTFEVDSPDNSSLVRFCSRRQQLFINKQKLEEWFNHCLSQIQQCIDAVISTADTKEVDAIYLVGRLGAGCLYVSKYIHSHSNIRTVIPRYCEMAIARGACLYSTIKPLHVSMATYGIMSTVPHDDYKMLQQQGERTDGTSTVRFHPLVNKDDLVDPQTVHRCVLTPVFPEQCTISVSLYSTTRDDPTTVLDTETGNVLRGVTELVQKTVDIRAGMEDLVLSERQVEVTAQFGKGEITFTAEYNRHNKITQVVFNHVEIIKK